MEWFHSFIFHCGGRKNLCKNADVEVKYSNSPNADPSSSYSITIIPCTSPM